ncbi:protelomerase family protein [Vibrio sp. Vb2853]|uniref:protelomerase family protein n=1 Tax=unclassified Vibrio TaxID=2614977 RepID=UPI002964D67A|nr:MULTISPECIES: protelomerase family protein [unclassified Vibrio]MDW1616787.1 protelomerase family protein [Vibrio sp. Vb2881]MDW1621499.1 protelomerase family protein [Vibrio sp. Vb2864]MDW1693690.1 protelomerase family protein [Vibrio sp. Vb2853]MDW1712399.1 protelomerase family protein [Vibrio sp. Vb2865]MDW1717520.1 protelomerase family protein [Vibrio sp. Vb2873]
MSRQEIVISSKSYIDNKAIEKRNRKTNLDKIIIDLLDELGEIQTSDRTQSAKTMAYNRAAKKVITALYGKRKQKSGNSLSLDGASKALTKVRNAVSATGAMHHSFDKSISSLRNNFPHCSYLVDEIDGFPLKETRERWSKLREKITHVVRVEKQLRKLSPDISNYATVVNKMAKDFPAWSHEIESLKTLKKEDRADAIERLQAIFDETREFYPALDKLKIDHEVMRHLTKDSFSIDNKQAESKANLIFKKEGVVNIDYSKQMQLMSLLLSDSSAHQWEALAVGVAMATGRRSIEVLFQGEFEKIDNNRLKFTGQAKKRGGVTGDEMEIYSLADANVVLKALSRLRSFANIASLAGLKAERHYSVNELVSNRTAGPLNKFMRDLIDRFPITLEGHRRDWVFKDTRAMYAKTCFELFFKEDKRWAKKDENMFYQELLGHHDTDAQNHYMQFKIHNAGAKWEPIVDDSPERRINAMKAMSDNEWIAARESRSSLHKAVIEMIEKDPWRTIKPIDIRKGRNYTMVKQYLEVVEDALKIDHSLDAIMERKAEEYSKPKAEEKPAEKARPEPEMAKSTEQSSEPVQPKFKAHKNDDGTWLVDVTIGDEHKQVNDVEAANMMDAFKKSWQHIELIKKLPETPPEPVLKKEGGMWRSYILINNNVSCECWNPRKQDAKAASIAMYKEQYRKLNA